MISSLPGWIGVAVRRMSWLPMTSQKITTTNLHFFLAFSRIKYMAERNYKKNQTHSFKNLRKVIGNGKAAAQAKICLRAVILFLSVTYVVLLLSPSEMHAIALSMCLIGSSLMWMHPGFGDAIEAIVNAGTEVSASMFFYPVSRRLAPKCREVILPVPTTPPRRALCSTF